MDVAWSPPLDDGGAPLQGYHILARLNSTGDWQLWETVPATETKATLQNLNKGVEYQFQVVATNKAGKSEPSHATKATKAKQQNVAPYIDSRQLRNLRVRAGERVKLDVPISGEPAPDVSWVKEPTGQESEPKEITSNKATEISLTSDQDHTKLVFNNITKAQEGTYVLTIGNDSGKDAASVTITVLDRPSPPEGCKLTSK